MIRVHCILFAALLCSPALLRADLTAAMAEANLEKRSEKAMDNAERAFKAARSSYKAGNWEQTLMDMEEVQRSVQLASDSLDATGKDAREKPKYFKRAEKSIYKLLRNFEDFRRQMGLVEREQLAHIRTSLQRVHDDLLTGILGVSTTRREQ